MSMRLQARGWWERGGWLSVHSFLLAFFSIETFSTHPLPPVSPSSSQIHLMEHLYRQMSTVNGLQLYGPPPPSLSTSSGLDVGRRAALCAFNVEGIHPTDISSFLDQQVGWSRSLTANSNSRWTCLGGGR